MEKQITMSNKKWNTDRTKGTICKIIGNVQAVVEGIETGVFSKKANLILLKQAVVLLGELFENMPISDNKK
jgi:hypothetical protein